jgi:hypothetical protein
VATPEPRDVDLDGEAPAGLEMRNGVPEALDLRVQRRGVRDRHTDVAGPRLCLQLGDHGRRELDPVHPQPGEEVDGRGR